MNALQEAKALLHKMSSAEKAQLVHWVVDELSGKFPGIEKTPGVVGGDACIRSTRIPVWSLVNSSRLGMSDEVLLEAYPSLTQEDLNNAWNYYRANKAEIDLAIKENEEIMFEPD